MNVTKPCFLPLTLLLAISIFLISTSAFTQFDGGDGSENDPWQIATVEQLQSLLEYPGAHFILTADIDASHTAVWNDGLGFEPIGDRDSRFTGSLDGNGHTITGLTINRSDENYVGLFGETHQSTLQNVHLLNAEITGRNYVGGLAGNVSGGYIEQSSVSGFINGENNVGGLTGSISQGTIRSSYTSASIGGTNSVGGITGDMDIAEVVHSYSLSDISGEAQVGGLAGSVHTITGYDTNDTIGMISGSFAAGLVEGKQETGGLIGSVIWIVLTKSDKNQPDLRQSTITFADTTTLITSYWDSVVTGQPFAVGSDHRWDGFEIDTTGSNTTEMQQQATYEGWDFDETWAITEGETYPYLQQLGLPVSNELESQSAEVPRSAVLHQNYPNPFNPATVIGYRLPENRNVTLEVFDIMGRRVAVLVDEFQAPGVHQVTFDASSLSSGVYLYRLITGEHIRTRKMVLVK